MLDFRMKNQRYKEFKERSVKNKNNARLKELLDQKRKKDEYFEKVAESYKNAVDLKKSTQSLEEQEANLLQILQETM